ncbi:MAG: TRAP transporter substrate-binding protein [Deltaproteobacteria bacterium]|nr:TRAP transporter substrate-binding protein [Deltaproteobacteria bacterium]
MRRLTVLCSIFVLLCAGFALTTAPAFGQAKPIELTYSIFFPAPAPQTQVAMDWAKEIEKRTNGRVKITIFPGGTLTAADKCYDGVAKGISDIGMSVFAYTRGRFPLTEVADLPLGIKSGLVATKLINAYYKKFNPKELKDVKVMYLHGHGPGFLHTKTAVEKLEDLKGMKIRCTGLAAKIVEKLGAVPVAMPMPDTYDSLKRGVVDGSMAPQESLKTWKWGEVVKFTTESWGSAYSTGFFVVMNKEKWNGLPKDAKRIIEQVNAEWIERQGKNWDDIDKAGREATLAAGNKIITLSKEENMRWAAAVSPILDGYVKNMKEKGLPGDKALKFYRDELKKLQ